MAAQLAGGRLPSGGFLVDRGKPVPFTFNGKSLSGFAGDTLASALLASGVSLVGRSFKYHRPRGIMASGPEEPNALVTLGSGGREEPNQRATTTELHEGLEARSQNHWPSLEFDLGAAAGLLSRFLPAGFYYKTFIHPRAAWKHLFEPAIRSAAGLGPAPSAPDPDLYESFHAHVDALVAGGGIAGLAAARRIAESGATVLVVEQAPFWGGRSLADGVEIDGAPASEWVDKTLKALRGMENARLLERTTCAGVYDHGYALACQRVADHEPGSGLPRQRLWRVRARRIVSAAGAIERPLTFAGNDLPGVMLASAVRDYLRLYGVQAGRRTAVVANNDDAYRTALALREAGVEVPVVVDARERPEGALPRLAREAGIRVEAGKAVQMAIGTTRISGIRICGKNGEGGGMEEVSCDSLAMSGGWSPAAHLWSHCGGKLAWDEELAMFRPDPERPPLDSGGQAMVVPAGAANGDLAADQALADAYKAAKAAARGLGAKGRAGKESKAKALREDPPEQVWMMPSGAGKGLRSKAWLDFQNDVKVSDVELAAREGFQSVEHAKRYTTLGMATDQGKLSNVNGLAVLAEALGAPIPEVGTTTFRPPYTPVTLGAIAGEAKGDLFKPVRQTPMHEWHDAHGADWEPVGDWRRPYAYVRAGETVEEAVNREILNARRKVGLLDASTLGKILVAGPDAGKFLDMMYTNMMSTLKPGRCRYGLMCTENGFLTDDGVVARIDERTFLCHTTSGGSDRIHAHMEEWLQTEWWTWKVYTANLTEQYAQIGIAGPSARKVLERMGAKKVSDSDLPFMSFADRKIGKIGARIYRISFSGELSFEVSVPARRGMELWEMALSAGEKLGIMPYGTEALHVMRAEKGFIMIGDETDGTVIPQDLGLDWAVSKKKKDFLGKRAQERSFLSGPNRLRLVGLLTENPTEVLPDGAYAVDGSRNEHGQNRVIGRVTSTYFSPTLGHSIALALVERGPERMGETLSFPVGKDRVMKARIVSPVFLDPDGERQNA